MWVLSSCWDNTGITMFSPEDDNTIVMYPLITLISHTEVLLNSGLGLVPRGGVAPLYCPAATGHLVTICPLPTLSSQQPGGIN